MSITNESDRQVVKEIIGKVVDSLIRQSAEKDLQKELKKQLKENFDIAPRQSGKVAKILFKQSMEKETSDFSEVESLYTQVSK